jgi:hypothetical protein
MVRTSSLDHRQVVSIIRGNYTIYDKICNNVVNKIIHALVVSDSFYLSFMIISSTTGLAHLNISALYLAFPSSKSVRRLKFLSSARNKVFIRVFALFSHLSVLSIIYLLYL